MVRGSRGGTSLGLGGAEGEQAAFIVQRDIVPPRLKGAARVNVLGNRPCEQAEGEQCHAELEELKKKI